MNEYITAKLSRSLKKIKIETPDVILAIATKSQIGPVDPSLPDFQHMRERLLVPSENGVCIR
jgi:hypothetical protein